MEQGASRKTYALPVGWRLVLDVFRAWRSAVEPLWVPGLALVCLLIGHFVLTSPRLDLKGKDYDWGQYAVIGVVYPSLLFGVPLLWRWRRWSMVPLNTAKWVLAVACLIMFGRFVDASADKYSYLREGLWRDIVILTVAQVVLMLRPWHRERIDPRRIVVLLVVAFVGWTISISLYLELYLRPPTFLLGFIAAFLLVGWTVWKSDSVDPGILTSFRLWTPTNLVAFVFIVLMSLRTDHLFEILGLRGAFHHWGAWVGTADMVRGGGWLLWDVPSMYGYLSILTLAAFPTDTTWQAMYLLSALSYCVVSGGLFLVLRTIRRGPLNWFFALAVAIAVPMFAPSFHPGRPVGSTFIFPNFGPYRYVWAFVLVAILVWEHTTEERSRRQKVVLTVGSVAWVLGVLWSPESAFFCSGAWLPAYVMIVLHMTAPNRHRWRSAAAWLALPPALFAAAAGLIVAIYAIGLGHLPDVRGFVDFVQELGMNVLTVVNDPIGPALGMLLGFCVLAIGAVYGGTRNGIPNRSFGIWIGLLGAFWAANSYGYTRGSSMLHQVAYSALVVMLVLVLRRPRVQTWDAVMRVSALPLMVILLTSPFAAIVNNPLAAKDVLSSLVDTAENGFAIEPLIPNADPSLQALMVSARVQPTDPVVYFGDDVGNLPQPWIAQTESGEERVVEYRQWLPMHPSVALRYIPDGRGEVYTSRFIDRAQLSGWMINRKTGKGATADFHTYVGGREGFLWKELYESYIPTDIYENADWQLVWWEYVGDDPNIVRPSEAFGQFGPLAPDIVVNGQPLAGTPHPEVWAKFGNGWGRLDPKIGGRWMSPGSILWIYSPEPRSATVEASTSTGTGVQHTIKLNSGWNRVKLGTEGIVITRVQIEALWLG